MADSAPIPLTHFSMRELHHAYVQGRGNPVVATQAYWQRTTMLDPQLHASITVAAETVLTQAQASAERLTRGQAQRRLDGIPLALKSNMDLAGLRQIFSPVQAGLCSSR